MKSEKQSLNKPRIVLLANGYVGLAITKFLRQRHEEIVATITNDPDFAQNAEKIRRTAGATRMYVASDLNHKKTLTEIAMLKPDIAVSAWFGHILKKNFIQLFPLGCINCHNSYLPMNRGKYPHVWAIAKGSPFGVTIHYIDPGIDSGDIIAQKRIAIEITDTAGTLYDKSLNEVTKLFKMTWPKILQKKLKQKKQDTKHSTHHFAKDVAVLDFIDANKKYKALDLINQLRSRSFRDRSYAYFMHTGQKVYVKLTLARKTHFV